MTTKTHYTTDGKRFLFCSGRSVSIMWASAKLDEVTCRACRRKLVAMSKKAA